MSGRDADGISVMVAKLAIRISMGDPSRRRAPCLIMQAAAASFTQCRFGPMTTATPGMPSAVQVLQVVAGGMHSAALADDGTVWSWGVNDEGALGRQTAGEIWEKAPERVRRNTGLILQHRQAPLLLRALQHVHVLDMTCLLRAERCLQPRATSQCCVQYTRTAIHTVRPQFFCERLDEGLHLSRDCPVLRAEKGQGCGPVLSGPGADPVGRRQGGAALGR